MRIRGINFKVSQIIALLLYYGFAQYLPASYSTLLGKFSKFIRYNLVKIIFKSCGKNVNIERKANFGSGRDIVIGDNSGIGINACIPSNTIIGENVMMGPNCYILGSNHKFDRTDIPMTEQGHSEKKQTIIEDDVWIGRCVTMTPGHTIKRGCIVAACAVITKDFPEYSIVGGNPAKLIKTRI